MSAERVRETMSDSPGGVLSVWAHPDDEAICAAGTLALCAQRGEHVRVICATRGEWGPISSPALASRETLGTVRERELRDACSALSIHEPLFLDLPDGGVTDSSLHDALYTLVVRIRTERPRVLLGFGPEGLYGHRDHIAMWQLAVDARRAAADHTFHTPGLAAYKVPRHFFAVWTGQQVRELFETLAAAGTPGQLWKLTPEHFILSERDVSARVDVHSVLTQKLRAIRAHRTQLAADHALSVIDDASAQRVLGIERFRCADGLGGDPLD
ncbi:MAG TPA: PIG-L deacetylase family protein [Polyangiales bacterium]|nr:PIG-L deacetylase family protein [Polyangiales bacterium]